MRHNVIGIPTLLVRRGAYEEVGPAFNEGTVFFDYTMWFRLAFSFPVGYLPSPRRRLPGPRQQVTMTSNGRGKKEFELFDWVDGLLASRPSSHRTKHGFAGGGPGASFRRRSTRWRAASGARLGHTSPAWDVSAATVDPRTPLALAGFVGCGAGRRLLCRLRYLVLRKRLRVHLRN